MKRPKKGPEIDFSKLKSGNLKPPSAIIDLYRELKGQHLLPVVVLLIIGLVAIPILIGKSSDHQGPAGRVHSAGSAAGSTKPAALKVTKWTPGLHDYKKSLRGYRPADPFAPKVVVRSERPPADSGEKERAPEPSEAPIESGGSEEAPVPVTPPSTPPSGLEPAPRSPGGEEGDGPGKEKEDEKSESGPATIDVQVSAVQEQGGIEESPLRRNQPQLTKLPNEALPALTYIGPSDDGAKAMMAVSSEVTAMIGDSKCLVPAKPCSLLALQVGAPETIVYGPQGLTYRIVLVRVGEHADTAEGGDQKQGGSNLRSTGGSKGRNARQAGELIGLGSGRIVDR